MDSETKPIAVGPWGGRSGANWDDGIHTTVRRILITHGAGIDSVLFEYDKQGSSVWSNKHGGSGGYKTDEVKLAFPNEFLTSVQGYYGPLYHGGTICVRSLTFISNEKTHGPFGVELGTFFSYPKPGHRIVGFFGRSGWFLDAIGAYLKPVEQKSLTNSAYSQNYVANGVDNSGYSVIHGSLGKDYDIVLAIKQRENLYNSPAPPKIREMGTNASPVTYSRQSSHSDYSDVDGKDKVLAYPPIAEYKPPGIVTLGPWGGTGGTVFDDGIYTGVRRITISRNVGIVYLKMLYEQNGEVVWGKRTGGTGGYKKDKIVFDYPYEILTHITGFYGPTIISSNIIKSLTFHTTNGKYGPFGEEQGTPFTSKSKDKEGMIVGFHGRKALFLDAIGVHVKEGKVTPQVRPPLPLNNISKPVIKPAIEGDPMWPSKQIVARGAPIEEPNHKIVKEPAPCGPGPWGGDGGKPWDDGVFTGIKQVFLTRSEAICSIQIEYDRNGQSVWSVKHGSSTGTKTHRIQLEYPHEMLTCISGYYGPVSKDDHCKVIKSITLYTSRGKYGPFGEEIGTYFTSTTTEGKVVGFHGRSGSYLDAIGIHMQHWLGNSKQAKPSYFKMFS